MRSLLFIFFAIFYLYSNLYSSPNQWKVTSGKVYFKSETDLETITGNGEVISGYLDLVSKKIKIEVPLGNIKTSNKLQTSHLHDNYFEIDKYPVAIFEGDVAEIKQSGEVKAIGSLTLHGIKKENVTISGNLEKTQLGLEQISYFTINLKDHNIEVPKLVFLKVNPIIQVKVKILWEIE
ncbi:MAG: YceI family protein [Leptospira sp.]|nr:YceI family protein [Leptospira sp.]